MRPRILFVDDNEDVRIVVSAQLAARGYEPTTAATCEEGLRLARDHDYDLILLDYVFADDTGGELCERIRESDPDTPILFFTASHPSLQREAVKRGAQGFVMKPEFGVLWDTISGVLPATA
jgi:CheY-like chemotaxis protein